MSLRTEPHLDSLGRSNRGWTKAGPGRQKHWTNPHVVWSRIEDDMHAQLKARAAKTNVSMSELVRTYIEWGLENDKCP